MANLPAPEFVHALSTVYYRYPKEIVKMERHFSGLQLVLASLESLGRDETFKSLESLVRLLEKVLLNICPNHLV